MSSSLARRVSLPQLSSRWTAPDAAAAQTDRNEGIRVARDGDDGVGALNRFWRHLCAEAASDLLRLYAECARLLEDHNGKRERLRHELDTDLVNQSVANQRQHDERVVAEATRLVSANGYAPLHQFLFYSDLLEASSLFPGQTIRHMPPADALRHLTASHVQAQFHGANVRVIGFGRNDAPTRQALTQDIRRHVEETRSRWFQDGGAADVQIGLR
jgi:hypothetical protein